MPRDYPDPESYSAELSFYPQCLQYRPSPHQPPVTPRAAGCCTRVPATRSVHCHQRPILYHLNLHWSALLNTSDIWPFERRRFPRTVAKSFLSIYRYSLAASPPVVSIRFANWPATVNSTKLPVYRSTRTRKPPLSSTPSLIETGRPGCSDGLAERCNRALPNAGTSRTNTANSDQ
jgi:hypothetical protein